MIGTQPDVVTVSEKTVMQGTNQYTKFLGLVSIKTTQANADNVESLVEYAEHYKEIMLQMKDTLVKERGEGQELKRKQKGTLFEKEILQREYQDLVTERDELVVQMTIMDGEKGDFEDNIVGLESHKSTTIHQVEEMRAQVEELVA